MSTLFGGINRNKHLETIRKRAWQKFQNRKRSGKDYDGLQKNTVLTEESSSPVLATSDNVVHWSIAKLPIKNGQGVVSEDDGASEEDTTDCYRETYVELERQVWLDLRTPLSRKSSKISVEIISGVYSEISKVLSCEIAKIITEMLFQWTAGSAILDHELHNALGFTPSTNLMIVDAPKGQSRERFINRQRGRQLLKEWYTDCLWESVKGYLEEKIFSQMLKAESDVIKSGDRGWAGVELSTHQKMKVWPMWVKNRLTKLFPNEFNENMSENCLRHFAEEIERRLVNLVNEAGCGVIAEIKHSDKQRDGVSVSWTL